MKARDYALKLLSILDAMATSCEAMDRWPLEREYKDLVEQLNTECLALVEAKLIELPRFPATGNEAYDAVLEDHRQSKALKAGYVKWQAAYRALEKRLPDGLSVPSPFTEGWVFLWRVDQLIEQADCEGGDVAAMLEQVWAVKRSAEIAGAGRTSPLRTMLYNLYQKYPDQCQDLYRRSTQADLLMWEARQRLKVIAGELLI